ncbi:hypothetical protein, partial [Salmonella enterica]
KADAKPADAADAKAADAAKK